MARVVLCDMCGVECGLDKAPSIIEIRSLISSGRTWDICPTCTKKVKDLLDRKDENVVVST